MKNIKDKNRRFCIHKRNLLTSLMAMLAVFMCLAITDNKALADDNLLVNGNFNSGLAGWSTFTYGSGAYVVAEIPGELTGVSTNPPNWGTATHWPTASGTNIAYMAGTNYNATPLTPLYDGTLQLTCGATSGNAGGYAWQIIPAQPGVQFTLTVQGGAQAWWLPTGEIRLWFLDTNQAIISSNFVETCLSINNPTSSPPVALYDTGVPYQNWTNIATSPPGTAYVKVELCNPNGTGSAWFDNADLTAPLTIPVITGYSPNGLVLLQNTNTLSFTVTSGAKINSSGIDVTLNGVDVSSGLAVTGAGTTNVSVSYSGLQSNTVYTAVMSVIDTSNQTTLKTVNFDTYNPSFVWEAEDYDFTNGQYYNFPVISSSSKPGSYFGVTGVSNVDYSCSTTGHNDFRPNDTTGISPAGDIARQAYLTAQQTDSAAQDQDLGYIADGNWFNYTRDYPTGTFNIYARLAGGQGPTSVSLDDVSGGATNNLGAFVFSGNNWGAWMYVPLVDKYGNVLPVSFNGKRTLRATLSSGGVNLNFFMLVPAVPGVPFLSNLGPMDGARYATNTTLSFTVGTAPVVLNTSGIQVLLNGVDVSSGLTISGSTTNKNVSYPLQPNTIYTAVLNITNANGVGISRTLAFDTFNETNLMIEAGDFDFNGGQFIDNPLETATNVASADSYYYYPAGNPGNSAQYGVDYTTTNVTASETYLYRQDGDTPGTVSLVATAVGTEVTSDFLRKKLINMGPSAQPPFEYVPGETVPYTNTDFDVGWWAPGTWINYTRTFPSNTYEVYGRLAGGNGAYGVNQAIGPMTMSLVTGGQGTSSQTTQLLGTFSDPNANGFQSWHWIPLQSNGTNVVLTLNGVETLKVTSPTNGVATGSVNAHFYMFVPYTAAAIAPFTISASVSAGTVSIHIPTANNGAIYTVQYSGSLKSPNWQTLGGVIGDGTVKTLTDTTGGAQRFYRVSAQ